MLYRHFLQFIYFNIYLFILIFDNSFSYLFIYFNIW